MHSSRMRTARSSSRPGGVHQAFTPEAGTLPVTRQPPPPPVNRITDTCENITFPQLRNHKCEVQVSSMQVNLTTPCSGGSRISPR